MKIPASPTSVTVLALATSAMVQIALACETPAYSNCLNGDGSLGCCPDDQLCQPWTPLIANCQPKPRDCPSDLRVGYAFPNIAEEFVDVTLEVCCSKCSGNPNCAAFMFINHRDGPPACYVQDPYAARDDKVYAQAGSIYGSFGRAAAPVDHSDKRRTPTPEPSDEAPDGNAPVSGGCLSGDCEPQNS